MKIIILGMDNTGKTTLAEQLSKELNIFLMRSKAKGLDKLNMESVIWADMTHSKDLILERFCFFEEMVYGKILRGKSNFKFSDKIFKTILENKPTIIYCRPQKKIIKNWKEREQMEGVIENSDKLLKQFDKVIKKARLHGLKVIKYDYTKETYFDVIAKL